MRRQAAIGVVGAVLACAQAGHAALPPYLTSGNFSVSLGPTWEGASKVAGIAYAPKVASKEPTGGWVWAPTCTAGAQTVQFTRKVELLGPPVQARLDWNVAVEKTALKSFELTANGHRVAHWADPMPRSTIDLTKAAMNAFHPGSNLLTVRATRAALAGGAKTCKIALSLAFEGAFATDLRVGAPEEKIRYTHATSVPINQIIVNEGKDTALDSTVRIWWGGGFHVDAAVVAGPGGLCQASATTEIRCPITQFAPGATVKILMRAVLNPANPAPGWDHYGSAVQVSVISATPDANSVNNYANINILMCEKPSREPACSNATD